MCDDVLMLTWSCRSVIHWCSQFHYVDLGVKFEHPSGALLQWTIPSYTILLEKNQYERIRQLRLIVYHQNLHLWYRVVYIGSIDNIGVILKVLYRWHKQNIWFLNFIFYFKQKFSFQIHKWNIQFCLFQIPKMIKMMIFKKFNPNFKNENFQFFHFKFSWHISIFSVPSRGMAKCSIQISKSIVFLFSIPLGWYGYFFSKFKNKKLQFKFQKWNIQFCLFQISKMIIFKKFNSNFKNENFQFFYFKFSWHISIFFIPLTWYLAIPNGQMSNSNFKIVFSFFHFSRVVWLIFFQNSKTKNFNSNLKNEYSILFISNFKISKMIIFKKN
jgi:hypothetical protein